MLRDSLCSTLTSFDARILLTSPQLLEKQKSGKKRAAAGGKVRLSQAAFNSVIGK